MQTTPVKRTQKKSPPPAGPLKRDPRALEKMLDQALEDSMPASDAVSTVMPEIKEYAKP